MVTPERFEKALLKLEEISLLDETEIVRDAAIQRFEFTFELGWKALRTYLREAHGLVCNSPKKCFREGLRLEMYDAQTTEKLLMMVDERNETMHTYDENRAQTIYKNIVTRYSGLLRLLLEKLR